MKPKTITLFLTATIFLVTLAVAYAPFGWVPNLGLTFGYYGEFNQMNRTLEKNEKLKVIDYGQHKDAHLEGFWISASTDEGRTFTLDVADSARIRTPKDEADGTIVFTGGYMNGIDIRFDSPFWESYGKELPRNTEDLISDMDYFLAKLESSNLPSTELKFEESLDSIRIKYERENQAAHTTPASRSATGLRVWL